MATKNKLRDEVTGLVDTWQERLHLSHWRIKVEWGDVEDGSAETVPEDMYDEAVIKFDEATLASKDREYIETTVIHELLHLHERDRNAIFTEIEKSLHPDTYRLFERVVSQLSEGFIDRVATCLYEAYAGGE